MLTGSQGLPFKTTLFYSSPVQCLKEGAKLSIKLVYFEIEYLV